MTRDEAMAEMGAKWYVPPPRKTLRLGEGAAKEPMTPEQLAARPKAKPCCGGHDLIDVKVVFTE